MSAARATTAKKTAADPTPIVTGYNPDVSLFASRYTQGGRTVYSLDLSLQQVVSLIPKPDVEKPSPGNRAIRPAHAEGFGKYLREREDWVSPSLMLRAPQKFDFETMNEVGGVDFGVLKIPQRQLRDLHIVDGQHRILGMHRAEEKIAEDLDKARSNLAAARRQDPDGRAVKDAREKIAALEKQRERLENQRISVQVFIESDPVAYKQMFFDIADNALGITASVKSRFDSQKVVHRALAATMEHPLLLGRVDPEGDRTGRNSPYLMGAKHVAEIIRTVNVGLDGRVSRRQESEFKEVDIANRAKDFFDMLIEAYPQMRALSLGQIMPEDLRRSSLLGSVLFVRILAGVYKELIDDHKWKREDVEEYLAKLGAFLETPVYEASIWIAEVPGHVFTAGGNAPHGRRQDLKLLKDTLVVWGIDKPKFLDEPPAPRPVEPLEEIDPEFGKGYTDFGADVPASS